MLLALEIYDRSTLQSTGDLYTVGILNPWNSSPDQPGALLRYTNASGKGVFTMSSTGDICSESGLPASAPNEPDWDELFVPENIWKYVPGGHPQGRIFCTEPPDAERENWGKYDVTDIDWRTRWYSEKMNLADYGITPGFLTYLWVPPYPAFYLTKPYPLPGGERKLWEQDIGVAYADGSGYWPEFFSDTDWSSTAFPAVPENVHEQPVPMHVIMTNTRWTYLGADGGTNVDPATWARSRVYLYDVEFNPRPAPESIPHRAEDPDVTVGCKLRPRPILGFKKMDLTIWDPAYSNHSRFFSGVEGETVLSRTWDGALYENGVSGTAYYTQASDVFMRATLYWKPAYPPEGCTEGGQHVHTSACWRPWETESDDFPEDRNIVDIDVDSNNDGSSTNDEAWEESDDQPGLLLGVNNNDDDNNGQEDCLDTVPNGNDDIDNDFGYIWLKTYDIASAPLKLSVDTGGVLRVFAVVPENGGFVWKQILGGPAGGPEITEVTLIKDQSAGALTAAQVNDIRSNATNGSCVLQVEGRAVGRVGVTAEFLISGSTLPLQDKAFIQVVEFQAVGSHYYGPAAASDIDPATGLPNTGTDHTPVFKQDGLRAAFNQYLMPGSSDGSACYHVVRVGPALTDANRDQFIDAATGAYKIAFPADYVQLNEHNFLDQVGWLNNIAAQDWNDGVNHPTANGTINFERWSNDPRNRAPIQIDGQPVTPAAATASHTFAVEPRLNPITFDNVQKKGQVILFSTPRDPPRHQKPRDSGSAEHVPSHHQRSRRSVDQRRARRVRLSRFDHA